MFLRSIKVQLFILGVTAIIFSRTWFSFIADPEGPNLLVVAGLAAVLYLISLLAYVVGYEATRSHRFYLAITIQAVTAISLYLLQAWF